MKLLLDTQMLIWVTFWPEFLPAQAGQYIEDGDNEIYFSPASLWEVAIKNAKKRADFQLDPRFLRNQLLENNFYELAITGLHVTAVSDLPHLHKDPFDRLLVAQAKTENLILITSDSILAKYPAPIIWLHK